MKKTDIERDVKISKKLSYLLRHGAHREGLNIAKDGFVLANDILLKLDGIGLQDIERIVKNDEKQRYTLISDKVWKIKANQGHSITTVDNLSLKPIKTNPDFDIIHGTYYKYWTNIKYQGLSRVNRNYIHFAKGLNFICGLRQSAEVFIYIDFKKATDVGLEFFESENGVILCNGNHNGIIQPKFFLKVLDKDQNRIY
ncbi:tRNA 2'-phosphotransferase 1 isoform X2 [Cotesia glomerata]|uniref:tRNA 2'-phosphotransferase 1 isoform X2 n=1 Tax=Cotesia glomerata TaxID=32391 RepID=UPI001D00242C|nr:tRNA 2'-phosphotransferase 1 isoform X2 [Cotesia glomerata]